MTGPTCTHPNRTDGVCDACGDCIHDVILNGACFYCGTTDIDPKAISPKKLPDVIAADRLVRKKP
ncbi:MAG: hypothetical protein H0T46_29505 [Deltaproteobacteria bacterium]|nr:hypothetical protein [Deltaproteobacteria bacterium]